MNYYGGSGYGGGYGGTSSMMGRMDPVKITLGVLVLLLAGAAGYLAYKYNSQCAGANGVSCTGTGVKLEDGVCTAVVTSCGDGTPDKDGVCRYSASSADGDGGFSLGTTGIIGIVVAGVLLLMGAGYFGLKKNLERERRILGVPEGTTISDFVGSNTVRGRSAPGLYAAMQTERLSNRLRRSKAA